MIRVSDEAKRLLGTLWTPQGEVLRLILRSSEADGAGRLAFRHGPGEGADQIVQHGGLQVLRIDRSVRRGSFDDSTVEVVDGTLGVVPPGPGPQTTALAAPFTGRSGTRNVTSSTRAREGGDRLKHEEFAERAVRRLEAVADWLEGDGKRLGIGLGIDGEASKTKARAQELRVAALLVRDEAAAVGREEREAPTELIAENLSLEAQG